MIRTIRDQAIAEWQALGRVVVGEEKGPQRRPQKRLSRQLEEVAKAVGGGGHCRLQMPLKVALGVRETVAGHRLGARWGGGGAPPLPMHPWWGGWGLRGQKQVCIPEINLQFRAPAINYHFPEDNFSDVGGWGVG